jgi:hypothetical protein
VRVFAAADVPAYAGAAPTWGSFDNPAKNEWFVVSDYFVDLHSDAAHASKLPDDYWAPRTLQQVVAHELDHLNGQNHLPSDPSKTPNSQACDDLQ